MTGTVKVFSDGRFYEVKLNEETLPVLRCLVRADGYYTVVRRSEREALLRNRA